MNLAVTWLLLTYVGDAPADTIAVKHLETTRRVEVSVQLTDQQAEAFRQTTLPFDIGKAVLRLCIRNDNNTQGPAIFSKYELRKNRLVLIPRYALSPDVTYEVVANVPGSGPVRRQILLPADKGGESPRVTAIYPSGRPLPANCLKFYIHFSQPMREGRKIFEQIVIRDDQNKIVPHPWRRVELWNEDATRLTMWIHPGRIKQGVNLREESGPVLHPGRVYRLVVTDSLRGLNGLPLETDFIRSLYVTDEDHDCPLPDRWKISVPVAGTRDPLTLNLRESIDHALLHRFITIYAGDSRVTGDIEVTNNETIWSFTPKDPWGAEKHHVQIDGRLEDLAGNTPLRPFDRDLSQKANRQPVLRLPFAPKVP